MKIESLHSAFSVTIFDLAYDYSLFDFTSKSEKLDNENLR